MFFLELVLFKSESSIYLQFLSFIIKALLIWSVLLNRTLAISSPNASSIPHVTSLVTLWDSSIIFFLIVLSRIDFTSSKGGSDISL